MLSCMQNNRNIHWFRTIEVNQVYKQQNTPQEYATALNFEGRPKALKFQENLTPEEQQTVLRHKQEGLEHLEKIKNTQDAQEITSALIDYELVRQALITELQQQRGTPRGPKRTKRFVRQNVLPTVFGGKLNNRRRPLRMRDIRRIRAKANMVLKTEQVRSGVQTQTREEIEQLAQDVEQPGISPSMVPESQAEVLAENTSYTTQDLEDIEAALATGSMATMRGKLGSLKRNLRLRSGVEKIEQDLDALPENERAGYVQQTLVDVRRMKQDILDEKADQTLEFNEALQALRWREFLTEFQKLTPEDRKAMAATLETNFNLSATPEMFVQCSQALEELRKVNIPFSKNLEQAYFQAMCRAFIEPYYQVSQALPSTAVVISLKPGLSTPPENIPPKQDLEGFLNANRVLSLMEFELDKRSHDDESDIAAFKEALRTELKSLGIAERTQLEETWDRPFEEIFMQRPWMILLAIIGIWKPDSLKNPAFLVASLAGLWGAFGGASGAKEMLEKGQSLYEDWFSEEKLGNFQADVLSQVSDFNNIDPEFFRGFEQQQYLIFYGLHDVPVRDLAMAKEQGPGSKEMDDLQERVRLALVGTDFDTWWDKFDSRQAAIMKFLELDQVETVLMADSSQPFIAVLTDRYPQEEESGSEPSPTETGPQPKPTIAPIGASSPTRPKPPEELPSSLDKPMRRLQERLEQALDELGKITTDSAAYATRHAAIIRILDQELLPLWNAPETQPEYPEQLEDIKRLRQRVASLTKPEVFTDTVQESLEARRIKILELADTELGAAHEGDINTLVGLITEFAWGASEDNSIIFFREQIENYAKNENADPKVAQMYVLGAKAYVYYVASRGLDNAFTSTEIKDFTIDSFQTGDWSGKIANGFQTLLNNKDLDIDFSWWWGFGGGDKNHDEVASGLQEVRRSRLASIPPSKRGTPVEKEYENYVNFEWSRRIGQAYVGKDEWDREITHKEFKKMTDPETILDFNHWEANMAA